MTRSEGCSRCICACVVLLIIMAVGSAIAAVVVLGFFFSVVPTEILMGDQKIKGHEVMAPQGDKVYEYLGIPYAKPPVEELRFADPQPIDTLPDDIFMATKYGNSCPQWLTTVFGGFPPEELWNPKNTRDEDCLNLNVWVPTTDTKRKPVMVWIYGGGFMAGASELWIYNGKTLAAFGDVIVVSINYRLGAFGFLSNGQGDIKGNFGLKDQALALQWVHDNIHKFGGDRNKVTLFGESSGASSIGYHMVSPQTQPLYQRAILQSGSPDSRWSFMNNDTAKVRYNGFLNRVGCSLPGVEDQLSCLRGKPQNDIVNNQWAIFDYMVFEWVPTIDGDFITDTPWNLLDQTDFSKHEYILGSNKDEGGYWNLYALPDFSKDSYSLQSYDSFKSSARLIDWDLPADTQTSVIEYYTTYQIINTTDGAANRDALDRVAGDRSFTCPTEKLARTLASGGANVSYYYLTHRASNEGWHEWLGVIHGAEIQWMFGMPLNSSQGYTNEEKTFSEYIMRYITNFAKTGSPESKDLYSWPRFTEEGRRYLEWKSPSQFIEGSKLREGFCDLYNSIRQQLINNL